MGHTAPRGAVPARQSVQHVRSAQPVNAVPAQQPSQPRTGETVAALDLGSNSFHLIVARSDGGRIQVIDRLKEMVRLGEGLDESQQLSPGAVERALACLSRFGQRLRGFSSEDVRVVGTNALRRARDSGAFLVEAQRVLGHRIDIISGLEEARLIYLGVSHALEDASARRLVVDIGGGSTEVIVGERFEARYMESLHIGCVSLSAAAFPDGRIDARRFRRAELMALQELEPHQAQFRSLRWTSALGASGTIQAVQAVLAQLVGERDLISAGALAQLRKRLIAIGDAGGLDALPGLQAERAPVFPGGVAILSATFEALGITRMRVSDGALREGLVYDLLGRLHDRDVREQTVEDLVLRHGLDRPQLQRVQRLALQLLRQLDTPLETGAGQERLLLWAARLHEIGLLVNHSQYQKHGAYLLRHLDMPGFSRGEQESLAFLVRAHRRKFPRADFEALPAAERPALLTLAVLLRLAVLLNRGRTDPGPPALRLEWRTDTLKLRFPAHWLDDHALTVADLEQEAAYLRAAGVKLRFG